MSSTAANVRRPILTGIPSSRSTRAPASGAGIFRPCITTSGTTICSRRRCCSTSTIDGERVPVLAQAGRAGYLYMLDRVTGEPVFDIVETPAPASDVPGREHVADAADSAQAAAARARELRGRRPRHGGGYDRRARGVLPRAARSQRRVAERRARSRRIGIARRARAALDDRVPGLARRRELGRRRGRSRRSASCSSTRAARAASVGSSRARPMRPPRRPAKVRAPSVCRIAARAPSAGRSRVSGGTMRAADSGGNEQSGGARAWPCQKPPWGELVAVERRDRRDRVAGAARHHGAVARKPAAHGAAQSRRTDRRRRAGSCSSARPTIGGFARSIRARAPSSGSRSCRCRRTRCRSPMRRPTAGSTSRSSPPGRLAIDDPGAADAQSLIAYALP